MPIRMQSVAVTGHKSSRLGRATGKVGCLGRRRGDDKKGDEVGFVPQDNAWSFRRTSIRKTRGMASDESRGQLPPPMHSRVNVEFFLGRKSNHGPRTSFTDQQ